MGDSNSLLNRISITVHTQSAVGALLRTMMQIKIQKLVSEAASVEIVSIYPSYTQAKAATRVDFPLNTALIQQVCRLK
jgi:hypothetical protein